MNRRRFLAVAGSATFAGVLPGQTVLAAPASASGAGNVRIAREPYRGWTDAIRMRNGLAEVVVVPSLGRVMQFKLEGGDDVFWENPELAGKPMPEDPWKTAMGSFGGDKTWPAPQGLWDWPPPDVFDRAGVTARFEGDDTVVLESAVSARFGIRTVRRVKLESGSAAMTIRTTYHKEQGEPLECAVWIITQCRHPERVFFPVPAGSRFKDGWSDQWKWPKERVVARDGLVSVTRESVGSGKIGNDGSTLLWVGERTALRIDVKREKGANYPDGGCSVEVYTNQDPVPYVELETVAPLHKLAKGQSATATNGYKLYARTRPDAWSEAKALLA